jgi:hypothetical protein
MITGAITDEMRTGQVGGAHHRNMTWYDRIPLSDRKHVDAIADWLSPIDWQLFVTLTFPWRVCSDTADTTLKEFINRLERSIKGVISYAGGKESKDGAGYRVGHHFHILMTAKTPIPASLVAKTWRDLVGPGEKTPARPDGDSIELTKFDREKLGVQYCLKRICEADGEWIFRWLGFLNRRIPGPATMSHKKRRQLRRIGRSTH